MSNYVNILLESLPKAKIKKQAYQKPDAVKELEQMAFDFHYRDSSLPVRYRTRFKFRDDTANGLTTCIIQYLKIQGIFVSRLNNTGIYNQRTGKYRPGTNRKGLPDIMATYNGKSLFIEIKHGIDKLSEHQEKVKAEQEQSGGIFYVARNFTDFKAFFDELSDKLAVISII
jgi:hypothetical protein